MFRAFVISLALLITSTALAKDVGMLNGMQATVVGPCGQMLVTGQFLAPDGTGSLKLEKKKAQSSPTTLELEIVLKVPDNAQGTRLLAVNYSTNDHSCPYGVSISFGDQTVLTGVAVAQAVPKIPR